MVGLVSFRTAITIPVTAPYPRNTITFNWQQFFFVSPSKLLIVDPHHYIIDEILRYCNGFSNRRKYINIRNSFHMKRKPISISEIKYTKYTIKQYIKQNICTFNKYETK